jgi:hypothetical protein
MLKNVAARGKIVKVVTVEALFRELKGGAAHQRGRGEAGSVETAMRIAMRDLLTQPKLRHKRYSMFTATFSVGEIFVNEEGEL